jgi:hypothetical protein
MLDVSVGVDSGTENGVFVGNGIGVSFAIGFDTCSESED